MSLGWEERAEGAAAGWKWHRESLWRTVGPSSACWYACCMHGSGVLLPWCVGGSVCECMDSVLTGRCDAGKLLPLWQQLGKHTDQ